MCFEEQVVGGGEALNASVGTVLGGRYRVLSTLGTGGMAVVYKAEDAVLGRCVALKTLHQRYAEEFSFRLRFDQEARVMASLDHENIVKVYDICQDDEVPFIVAEYIEGRDVGDMLKSAPKGCLSEPYTIKIAEQLLGALAYAHLRGVIHRDVKPSNLLITDEDVVKVADFGIARVIEDEEEPGEIVGSARYMSPEQLKGEETTPQSDLYSVGILLHHCLTGRPPFSGDAGSVARQHMRESPIPPRKLNAGISPRLEAVILKALAKDPGGRYPSASAMLEDLQKNAEVGITTEIAKPGERRTRKKLRVRNKRHQDRKILLASAMLVLLLLGAGTAVAGLVGRMDFENPPLPWLVEEAATPAATPAQPVAEGPAGSPDASREVPEDVPPEAPDVPAEPPGSSQEPESPPQDLRAAELVPVPSVDAYFDYFAAGTLRNSGFQPQFVYGYREGYAPNGVAWGTDPVVGTLMPVGSTITVYVTPRNQPQQVPQPQIQQPQVQPQIQPPQPPLQPQIRA